MIEIFKDIKDYEGLYQVSNVGNVKSLGNDKTKKEKILKPAKDKKGYLYVCLCNQEIRKIYKIHRLVGMVFLPNPQNLPEINHRDEDKTNNRVENLEWCDVKYNRNYGTRTERSALSQSKQVLCVETNKIYISANEAARQLGFSQSNISRCCNGKLKQAYGFHWKYVS